MPRYRCWQCPKLFERKPSKARKSPQSQALKLLWHTHTLAKTPATVVTTTTTRSTRLVATGKQKSKWTTEHRWWIVGELGELWHSGTGCCLDFPIVRHAAVVVQQLLLLLLPSSPVSFSLYLWVYRVFCVHNEILLSHQELFNWVLNEREGDRECKFLLEILEK